MKKFLMIFLTAAAMIAFSSESHAQFSKLSFDGYGVKSISPESFTSVNGAVWINVTNPMEGFTVSEIKGMVYKHGSPFITGWANDFHVINGTRKTVISGNASLCPGVSLWLVLALLFFDPDDYSVDMSMRITLDSGATRTVEKKNMPVRALLKLI